MTRLERRKIKPRKDIVISQMLNQASHELIGGLWVDENNKYHLVGMLMTEDGIQVPDFPQMENVFIKQAYQVGLKH